MERKTQMTTCPSTFVEPIIQRGIITDYAVLGCSFEEHDVGYHYNRDVGFGWIESRPGSWVELLESGTNKHPSRERSAWDSRKDLQ